MAAVAAGLATMLTRAVKGWKADEAEIAQGLVHRLRDKLRAEVEIIETGDNAITFIADLSHIRFRGANDVACLLATGSESDMEGSVRRFWQSASGPGQLIIVLGLSEGILRAVERMIPSGFICLLKPGDVASLFDSPDPLLVLKAAIREQIPLRRLIPYVTRHAVQGNMFYGRRNEIQQLIEDHTENFAIAGQGRIGKSSLVIEYQRQLKKRSDPRLAAHFYIDFYTCQPKSEAAIAQFLAKKIDGTTRRSANMTLDDLESFLRYHAHRLNRPIDFLLDEVDLVCRSQTFRILAHISKQEHGPIARLVLLGRRELLREALNEDSPLGKHVCLMRLEPLDEESARRLLTEPLCDMGIKFETDALVNKVLSLTGRLPQLLQYFAGKVAKLACEQDTDTLTDQHIEKVRLDYETTELFTGPIKDLKDPLAGLIALLLLERGIRKVDRHVVLEIAGSVDIQISADRALGVCDDLLLANFLSWTKSGYQIANEAMGMRVRETGYLTDALVDARQDVRRRLFI